MCSKKKLVQINKWLVSGTRYLALLRLHGKLICKLTFSQTKNAQFRSNDKGSERWPLDDKEQLDFLHWPSLHYSLLNHALLHVRMSITHCIQRRHHHHHPVCLLPFKHNVGNSSCTQSWLSKLRGLQQVSFSSFTVHHFWLLLSAARCLTNCESQSLSLFSHLSDRSFVQLSFCWKEPPILVHLSPSQEEPTLICSTPNCLYQHVMMCQVATGQLC